MSSVLYILNENLEPLISRNIRALPSTDLPIAQFRKLYHPGSPPVIRGSHDTFEYMYQSFSYVYIRRDSLFFVSLVDNTVDIMETLHYLEQFYLLLKNYFTVKMLDKNLILDNPILVMELLDESIDFGFIQVTDAGLIKDYIRVKINVPEIDEKNKQLNLNGGKHHQNEYDDEDDMFGSESDEGRKKIQKQRRKLKHRSKSTTKRELGHLTKKVIQTWKGDKKKRGQLANDDDDHDGEGHDEDEDDTFMNSDIAKTTVMAISWRTKGIHYAKNEFYLDVIEKIEYYMDYESQTVRKNTIHGQIVCKSFLSGMPELHVSINKILNKDKQFLSSCKFHQCVSLESIEDGKEIIFTPPDGDFILCSYELKRHVRDQPIIKLSQFELKPKLNKFKLQIHCTVESHFKPTNITSKLNVQIPLKQLFKKYKIDLSKNIKSKCDEGKVLFNVSDDFLLWEIGAMKGGHGENQLSMVVEFALFNQEEYDRKQEELRTSMNPPPLVKGIKLEEIYQQIHADETDATEETPVPNKREQEKAQLLHINFEIPYSTLSGINIEYLKIEEPQLQYQSFPWVRYKAINDEEYAYAV
ncbi:similar to Saccharomyces cerevisiae YHL019C APM2 Protein of unknown function, homologous to the medium chain of mammalian clathrin-associated protein complex [Maudiozyma barnettii]|uniref:MHD domain-containing protein n=1 Tax=Maudiozyma barnettii TaxID=61262 RepID=A0A8H2ZMA4_9SACH|nr:Apm2p [Kazachstania barnettii]CAB4256897.1 similar to Saccharomyces cerevisiae YHL019C APM2 Protein of unknown function, homologous to the medium chain of mammalian clathrin-associated protein complex [Kazachstania barnettii]CAD1785502.1 similar to Saccharomyces cerevisiae YHL019C APM2 Protein of unknown function, homologous to the medium chain of mammalian clathrin-associated protein complex [Kazachstania barnettii]